MRTVQFIKSVNISERQVYDGIEYLQTIKNPPINVRTLPNDGGDFEIIAPIDQEIQVSIVPIHKITDTFKKSDRPYDYFFRETYIAYSKEVEFYLQAPFNRMHQQFKDSQMDELNTRMLMMKTQDVARQVKRELYRFSTANIWTRLKYLFTGKLTG